MWYPAIILGPAATSIRQIGEWKEKKTDLLSIIKIDLLHLFRMKTMERKKNVLISID